MLWSRGDASWNVFRYVGYYLHFGGMIFGLLAIVISRSVAGFSWKAQVMYQLVYVSRYLDVFTEAQAKYLLFFKLAFNLVTATMLGLFYIFRDTYDARLDSCNIVALITPGAVLAFVVAGSTGFREDMWTFSEFLEPVALLPQYIMCYRATRVRLATIVYTFAVGGYRILYILNWLYKRYTFHGAYHDYVSWCGGAVECTLFFGFVLRIVRQRATEASWFGKTILSIDDGANSLSERIELSTFGRRLPLGVSGGQDFTSAGKAGGWSAADRQRDEEACGLLGKQADSDADD